MSELSHPLLFDLLNTHLADTDLAGADLSGAKLSQTTMPDGTRHA